MRPETPRLERRRIKSNAKIERYERHLIRKVERRGTRSLAGIALLSAIAAGENAYWTDVTQNQEVQAQASISITVKGEPRSAKNADSAITFMNGFGQNDADNITHYLGPSVQQIVDGELWSVGYGNAPLDPQQITNRIIALAQERNIRRISLVGYSAGGVVAMEVAEKLYEQSNLQLQAIIPTSTPDGEEGLRPEQLQTKDILMTAADIIPGSKYSTPIRYIGEMAFRMNMYNDGDLAERWQDFWQTSDDVSTAMKEARLPGTWLLVDQTLAISNARLQERITHIAELSQDRLQPVIIYLGTAKPGYDTMVNDTDSGENICAYATEANLRCLIYDVPGAIHNRPDLATDAFEATIKAAKQDIHQALNGALAAYVLTRPIKEGLAPSYLEDPATSSGGVLASETSSQSATPSS